MDLSQTKNNNTLTALIDQPGQKEVRNQSAKAKRSMIAALLTNPTLTQKEISKAVGTCAKTVERVSTSLKTAGAMEAVDAQREAYSRLINEQIPQETRVKGILGQIADVRFALPAIKYVDQITGVGPLPDPEQAQQLQPMFVLQGCDTVNVLMGSVAVKNPVGIEAINGENVPAVTVSDSDSKR